MSNQAQAELHPLVLNIKSNPATLAQTRKEVESFCAACGLEEPACHDVGLCLNEALANVMRHAYSGQSDQPIKVEVQPIDAGVKVKIQDWGNGFNPDSMPHKEKDIETPGGLGMICLRSMLDSAKFIPQKDGMVLEMTKKKGIAMPDLNITSDLIKSAKQDGTTVICAIAGEIDLHTSPELRTQLLDILQKTSPKKLILNLASVPYMDSSAIAVLVESLQKVRKLGGKICLTNLQPRVKGLLEIARLNTIFVIAKDEAEAMKA